MCRKIGNPFPFTNSSIIFSHHFRSPWCWIPRPLVEFWISWAVAEKISDERHLLHPNPPTNVELLGQCQASRGPRIQDIEGQEGQFPILSMAKNGGKNATVKRHFWYMFGGKNKHFREPQVLDVFHYFSTTKWLLPLSNAISTKSVGRVSYNFLVVKGRSVVRKNLSNFCKFFSC